MNDIEPQLPKTLLGYQIDHYQRAQENAIRDGYQLIVLMRQLGAKLRIWCSETIELTKKLIDYSHLTVDQEEDVEGLKLKLHEISQHERKILNMFKTYLNNTSKISNRVKGLNPPLSEEQLAPFWSAFNDEKEKSVLAMDTLSPYLEELIRQKNRIARSQEPLD